MALPTVTDLKTYFRVEHDVDDQLLEQLLREATALVETFLGRPILAAGVGGTRTYASGGSATVAVVRSVRYGTTTGSGGATLTWPGTVSASDVSAFEDHPDYADRIEPALSAAIRDTVGDYYQRRNPSASYESAGGGVSVTYAPTSLGLPLRIQAALAPLKSLTF